MEERGRKNAAGDWLRAQFLHRGVSAALILMGLSGFAVGFGVRGLPFIDGGTGLFLTVGVCVVLLVSYGIIRVYLRRIDKSWVAGFRAERRVGDVIDHALARPGCAYAHDVKEALGCRGNVDHIVMTPMGIWVVETKARWQGKRQFRPALRQVAENARRVRRHLDSSVPVRGALVIADRWDRSLEAQHDWNGEPIKAFGLKTFWDLLRAEAGQDGDGGSASDRARVEKTVWGLGSLRHLES